MESSKEPIPLSRPRALPKLEPSVLARKVNSLGVEEREGETDTLRDDWPLTLSPQPVFSAYLGARHNSQPSFPLPTLSNVTVLQDEGAKTRAYSPPFLFDPVQFTVPTQSLTSAMLATCQGGGFPPASLAVIPTACSWVSRSLFQSNLTFSGRKIPFPSP